MTFSSYNSVQSLIIIIFIIFIIILICLRSKSKLSNVEIRSFKNLQDFLAAFHSICWIVFKILYFFFLVYTECFYLIWSSTILIRLLTEFKLWVSTFHNFISLQ